MDINWDDIIVTSAFNDLENRINFKATINENIVPLNDYFLWVEINNTVERARFENNPEVMRLEAEFDTRIRRLKRSYPYTLRVVDSKGKQQYIRMGTLSYDVDAQGDIQRGLGEIIFPEDLPKPVIDTTNTGSSTGNSGNTTTTTTTTTTIVNENGEVVWEETITTTINNTNGSSSSNQSTSGSSSVQDSNINSSSSAPTRRIVPKPGARGVYPSKSSEPTRINGIGNNPNYNSWRK